MDVTTDIVYSQDIQQLETRSHMSWTKTTKEEITIKDIEKAHETWIGSSQPNIEACQELYATEEQKVDKTVYSTDELQAYEYINHPRLPKKKRLHY